MENCHFVTIKHLLSIGALVLFPYSYGHNIAACKKHLILYGLVNFSFPPYKTALEMPLI